ncbi:hypothetical protein GWI33_020339 [Rhynchophorus ferrugineus]|uniref:Uncharacterized protein n=1 Tax=Rhynchophorus ferrugineus TaxID=354439 RepID=A0A834M3G6_RHYFE|nr:hypothetical protein GWI33_020339 [Rhynchophorus ferrugineus]
MLTQMSISAKDETRVKVQVARWREERERDVRRCSRRATCRSSHRCHPHRVASSTALTAIRTRFWPSRSRRRQTDNMNNGTDRLGE